MRPGRWAELQERKKHGMMVSAERPRMAFACLEPCANRVGHLTKRSMGHVFKMDLCRPETIVERSGE